ncbi:hypothetical protein BGX23_012793 [Mortierella sp. AD031]|nr:hypothetical protein BGX23_012793 [Mortierella sp. AD031]
MQVCQLWNYVLIPYLWATIDDSLYCWSNVLSAQDTSSVRALFVKNGQFIRQLHVHSQEMRGIVSASGVCTNLRALKIYDPDNKDPGNTYTDPDGNLWDVVQANADLDTLRLGRSVRELLRCAGTTAGYRAIASLRNLVTLQDHTGALEPHVVLERYTNLRGFLGTEFSFAAAEQLGCHLQLRTLELKRCTESRIFLILLNSLRNLEYLTIAGLHDVGQHFGQYVETLLVNTPLRLKGFSAHAPHLEVFRQTQGGESIHFHYKPHPALNVANIFFQTCTKLRVFDGIHHTIDAAKMCEKPWVCHSLEVFRCQIVRVARLTEQEQALLDILDRVERHGLSSSRPTPPLLEEEAATSASERQQQYQDRLRRTRLTQNEQQRQVYDRLAGLRSLRRLDLGFEYRRLYSPSATGIRAPPSKAVDGQEYILYSGPFRNTLELSLASGLDRLAALTRLEVFGFDGVDHRVGKPELEWVASAWPRLKEMRGLHDNPLLWSEPDNRRTELRRIMQTLRRDVRHQAMRPKPLE